jgi:predicted 2-oxoglutarate/Fe(II)-dependent dioxygenase YbiX
MNDYVDQPFVYENYIATESAITPQLQDQLVIEERGEPGSGSNIFTVADVFTDTQCDEIMNYIQKNSALWGERDLGYASGNNVECKFLTLKDLINIPGAKEIDDLIFKRLGAVLTTFRAFRPDFKGIHDNGYTLRKIFGGTKRHVDGVHSKTGGFTKIVRALSFIAVLNDDYDGGIFNFPAHNLKFKVKKGEVVMFPPYWTHPHSVTSVGEGQARYTINTWILENFLD